MALTPQEQKELFGDGLSARNSPARRRSAGATPMRGGSRSDRTEQLRQGRLAPRSRPRGRGGHGALRRARARGHGPGSAEATDAGRGAPAPHRPTGSTTSRTPMHRGLATCTSPTRGSRRPTTTVSPGWRSTCTTRSTPTRTGTSSDQSRWKRSARPCRSSRNHSHELPRAALGDQEVPGEPGQLQQPDAAHPGLRDQVAAVAVGVVALHRVVGVAGVQPPAEHRLVLGDARRVQVGGAQRGAERQPGAHQPPVHLHLVAADEQPQVRHPDDVERGRPEQRAVEQRGDPAAAARRRRRPVGGQRRRGTGARSARGAR